jgi:DNA polymerase III delta subunit
VQNGIITVVILERRRDMGMEIIKEADFRKQIKSEPKTGYLFYGDEDYMKSFALKVASEAISPDPSFSFFNEMKLDALSYSPSALVEAMMPLPMMADRKLIIISGLDFNAMKSNEFEAFCDALKYLDEYDYNTLIVNTASDRFDAGTPKKPSGEIKALSEYLVPVLFERNTPSRLNAWIAKHFAHNGVKADPAVCNFIVEWCGRDMYNLSSQTDKLSFYVLSQGRDTVTRDDVCRIASTSVEYDTYAFSNSILAGRKEDALAILADMKRRKIEPVYIMGEISKNACDALTVTLLARDGLTWLEISKITDIRDFIVQRIMQSKHDPDMCRRMVAQCRAADKDLKSSFDRDYDIIERLICVM